MSSVIIRILLRYLAAFLVGHALLSPDVAGIADDPDISSLIELGAGAGVGVLAEFWYYLARRFGWAK